MEKTRYNSVQVEECKEAFTKTCYIHFLPTSTQEAVKVLLYLKLSKFIQLKMPIIRFARVLWWRIAQWEFLPSARFSARFFILIQFPSSSSSMWSQQEYCCEGRVLDEEKRRGGRRGCCRVSTGSSSSQTIYHPARRSNPCLSWFFSSFIAWP